MTHVPIRSLWIETAPDDAFATLAEPLDVDVAIVGGGIAGITTAVLLKRAGKTVAVVEAKRILHGATGYTTAKLTAGHGLIYATLEQKFGEPGARLYADANQSAIERVAQLVEEYGIECQLERKPNYVYAERERERGQIEEEVEAARRAGLPVSFVRDVPLPYPIAAAVRLEHQAQFHPRKYLLPLARTIPGDGSHVVELTRVLHVEGDGPCRVRTDRGTITARDVVLASHLPILDRGFFFAKAHPHRSYAVAARIDEAQDPQGMYINSGTPTRSVRTAHDEHGLLLLVGGEGHKPGTDPDPEQRFRALEEFARRHWQTEEYPYRWATQDYLPVDEVPYVGRLTRRGNHVYVATGFKKWGMSNGTVAAMILSDLILGRPNPWAELYDAKRLKPAASALKFAKENGFVAKHFFGARLKRGDTDSVAEIARGEGKMLKLDGKKTAVYRDDDGDVHTLSPVCTHLGCHVEWNPAERSWDCPCHGSRFSGEGAVIQGPAVRDLEHRPVSEPERQGATTAATGG